MESRRLPATQPRSLNPQGAQIHRVSWAFPLPTALIWPKISGPALMFGLVSTPLLRAWLAFTTQLPSAAGRARLGVGPLGSVVPSPTSLRSFLLPPAQFLNASPNCLPGCWISDLPFRVPVNSPPPHPPPAEVRVHARHHFLNVWCMKSLFPFILNCLAFSSLTNKEMENQRG